MGDDITKLQEMEMAVGTGLTPEDISRAKQSKSEKKARKCMFKLGLKSYTGRYSDGHYMVWCALYRRLVLYVAHDTVEPIVHVY